MIIVTERGGLSGKPLVGAERLELMNETARNLFRENLREGHKLISARRHQIVLEKYGEKFRHVVQTTYQGKPRDIRILLAIAELFKAFRPAEKSAVMIA